MYQAVPSHNAIVDHPGLSLRWTWKGTAQINGGLAVVDNHVFVDDFAERVVSLDLLTGKVEWVSSASNILMSTPVVANGLVIVGSGHNGRLHGDPEQSPYAYSGQGTQSRTWGRPEGDQELAFDASTGEKRWSFDTVGEDMPSPALIGDILVFVNGDLHAYALNARTGELQWQQQTDGVGTMASANVSGDRALLSFCNDGPYHCHTVAVDAESGRVEWESPLGNSDSAPTVGGGLVFVSGLDNANSTALHGRGVVAALDLATGRLRWIYRSPALGPFTQVGSNERAIAGTYANNVYFQAIPTSNQFIAFDANSGKVKWELRSVAPIKMSCIVRNGVVYVGDTAGVLYALDARTGFELSLRTFPKPFSTAPPIAIGESLIVVDGTDIIAFPIASMTGRVRMHTMASLPARSLVPVVP